MARIPSNMIPLGTKAFPFALTDTVSGKKVSFNELTGKYATVVMFICNHCPFVKHVNAELVRMSKEFIPKGVAFIAISANDTTAYPEDGPEKMKETAFALGYPFPYLFDEDQSVAKAYDAACTPDFYIFDKESTLAYRGQLDDSRPGNGIAVTGTDIRAALNAMLDNQPVNENQKPSIGCSIKWTTA